MKIYTRTISVNGVLLDVSGVIEHVELMDTHEVEIHTIGFTEKNMHNLCTLIEGGVTIEKIEDKFLEAVT